MNGELVRERDKVVRWKLIALNLAEGLDVVGKRIVDKDKEKIFIKKTQLILRWIKEDKIDNLYGLFCEGNNWE